MGPTPPAAQKTRLPDPARPPPTCQTPGPTLARASINSAASDHSGRSSFETEPSEGTAAGALGPTARPSLGRSSSGVARAPVVTGQCVSRRTSLQAAGHVFKGGGGPASVGGESGGEARMPGCMLLPNERRWLGWFLVTLIGSLWTGVFTVWEREEEEEEGTARAPPFAHPSLPSSRTSSRSANTRGSTRTTTPKV